MPTRRGFMQTVSAAVGAALLPSIVWPKLIMPAPAIDLWDFVEDDKWYRYKLDAPFFQQGHSYGTDGRILIRTAQQIVAPAEAQVKLPNAAALFENLPSGGEWTDWPREKLIHNEWHEETVCPECRGHGRVGAFGEVKQCFKCDGDGGSYLDADDNYCVGICPTCHDIGYVGGVTCDYCKGEKYVRELPALQALGSQVFAGHYTRRIARLPGAQFREFVPIGRTDQQAAADFRLLHFRCEGGEGLLCPIQKG